MEAKTNEFYEIFEKVIISEKATRMREFDNKLTLIVKRKTTKPKIKKLCEIEFKKKVKKINTFNDVKGQKKAIVTFSDELAASDIATEMGLV